MSAAHSSIVRKCILTRSHDLRSEVEGTEITVEKAY